jgi:hypothetical protein
MLIRVTQHYIDHGVKEDCGKCPAALAIIDAVIGATGRAYRVVVDGMYIRFYGWNSRQVGKVETPETVIEFIEAFDSDRPVSPFEFPLDLDFLLDPAVIPAEACTDSPCDL